MASVIWADGDEDAETDAGSWILGKLAPAALGFWISTYRTETPVRHASQALSGPLKAARVALDKPVSDQATQPYLLSLANSPVQNAIAGIQDAVA